jgi:predicted enzyme related to lactoylglutathione lyase
MNFNSILIGSEEPERLAAYYTRLFYTAWMIGAGAVTVGPHTEVTGRNAQPGRLIWNIETPDVKADFERLKSAGATVVRDPYSFEGAPDAWIATFADPDDNYFQLMSPMGPPEG